MLLQYFRNIFQSTVQMTFALHIIESFFLKRLSHTAGDSDIARDNTEIQSHMHLSVLIKALHAS